MSNICDIQWSGDTNVWRCVRCHRSWKDRHGTATKGPVRRCKIGSRELVRPGTELKLLLTKFKIPQSKSCRCNERVQRMNDWGPDGCFKRIELITDWLEEEAEKQGLLFVRIAGKLLIRRAIRNARKKLEQANELDLRGDHGPLKTT